VGAPSYLLCSVSGLSLLYDFIFEKETPLGPEMINKQNQQGGFQGNSDFPDFFQIQFCINASLASIVSICLPILV